MRINHSAFFVETVAYPIIREFYAVLFDDIAGSADGSRAIVAMFGNMISGSRYNEAGASRDVEGIFSITACTYNINRGVSGKVYRYAGGEQCFTETYQFFYLIAHWKTVSRTAICCTSSFPGYVEQQITCFGNNSSLMKRRDNIAFIFIMLQFGLCVCQSWL